MGDFEKCTACGSAVSMRVWLPPRKASFIFTNGAAGALLVQIAYGGQPMDDISEADEASLIAKANASAKQIEADQEVEQQKLEELIGEYGKLMQIEKDISSIYREIANNDREMADIYRQEVAIMKQQIGKLDAINSDLKAMAAEYSTLIQNSKESSAGSKDITSKIRLEP